MRCPSCSSAVADGRRFCPSCGTPLAAAEAVAHVGAATAGAASPATLITAAPRTVPGPPAMPAPYPNDPVSVTAAMAMPDAGTATTTGNVPQERTAQLLDAPAAHEGTAGRAGGAGDALSGAGDALADAGEAVRRRVRRAADRFGAAPAEVRVALVGAAITVLSFLVLPYADRVGTAAELGGRLWWRPLAAVVATVLLATTLRARGSVGEGTPSGPPSGTPAGTRGTADRLLAALVVATVGATEAGLVGLFSGDADGTRVGYYGILAGLVTVLLATGRAARRRCCGG